MIHWRAEKRLLYGKCAKDIKLLDLIKVKETGENNGTAVKLVDHVRAPCATNKPRTCYGSHIATVRR